MDTQLLLKTAMLAGEIMLRSGAETYRVEDTMHHILKTADHIEMAEVGDHDRNFRDDQTGERKGSYCYKESRRTGYQSKARRRC